MSSSTNQRKRITLVATEAGVQHAEQALISLGFDSKTNFAKAQLMARNTVTKFFQRDPIQLDSFQRICQGLKLNWQDIAELDVGKTAHSDQASCGEGYKPVQAEASVATLLQKQVIVTDSQQRVKAEIILKGDSQTINHDLQLTLQLLLQQYAGNTITITDMKPG